MKVLIVDDDRLVSTSLKTILESDSEIQVMGLGNSGKQAVELYFETLPDVLLMDIRMEGMTGIEAAELILGRDKNAKILFLTTFSDDEYIVKALKIGAKGYILKQNFESIVQSIKTVNMGQRVFGDDIITKIPAFLSDHNKSGMADAGLSEKRVRNSDTGCKWVIQQGNCRNTVFKRRHGEKLHQYNPGEAEAA